MLGETEVVPGLWVVGIERDGLLEGLLGLVKLLEGHEGDALIDGGLCQLGVFLEGFGEGLLGFLSELLAHQCDASIVEADRIGIEVSLRSGGE